MSKNFRIRLQASLAAIFLAIFLLGCSMGRPTAIYNLVVSENSVASGGNSQAQVMIPVPRAIRALNTNNIAVTMAGNQISYFTRASWSDDLPLLVQARLVETFEIAGKVGTVGIPGDRMTSDYRINTEIRAFHLDVSESRRAVVEIVVKIINDKDGKVVDGKSFKSTISVASQKTDDVVAALNTVANSVFAEIVSWTLKRI